MPTNYISRKFKTTAAKKFRDSFAKDTPKKVGYVFLAKSTEYPDENVAQEIFDTVATEKETWDNMIAAKRIAAGDVEYVIPKYVWTANTRYKQYDDMQTLDFLLSETVEGEVTIYPMYVMNSEGNVYKCLCNNISSLSTIEPKGTYTENDGFISTQDVNGTSSYLWKYLYNVKDSNKFFVDDWMPVPYTESNTSISMEYDLGLNNLIDGGLNKIVMTNRGNNYVHTTVNVESFVIRANSIIVDEDIDLSTSNIKVNMQLSGSGILQGTYITQIINESKTLILSTPTIDAGGGTVANAIQVLTRVEVVGDGTETIASVRLNNSNQVEKIDVINTGVGYTRANVIIHGSGTAAAARAVLPPKFGHGYNPAIELCANNVMIVQRIGEVDASENGLIPTDTSFRQYGLLIDPYKYGENQQVSDTNANSVVSLTTDVTVLAGASYQLNEFVYQGTLSNRTFEGYVVSQDATKIKLTNVFGTPEIGPLLTGANSAVVRPVISVENPDLQPLTGDILYTRNVLKVDRSVGQAEEIRLVFQF